MGFTLQTHTILKELPNGAKRGNIHSSALPTKLCRKKWAPERSEVLLLEGLCTVRRLAKGACSSN